MSKLGYVWFCVSLIILSNFSSIAQQYSFKNYSLEEGLPQSEVFSLIQDKKGNLWLGTNGGGISRFNGQTFVNYNKRNGLADNNIRALLQDSKENLWIGTSIGISSFNGVSFRNYNRNDSLPNAIYFQIAEDQEGRIWTFGVNQKSRYLMYQKRGRFVNFLTEHSEIEENNQVFGIFMTHEGELFIITQNTLYSFFKNKLTKSNYNNIPEFQGQIIAPALQDTTNQLWFRNFVPGFGTQIFKMQNGKPSRINLPSSISPLNLGNITLDSDQRLWISILGAGVLVINGKKSVLIDEGKGLVNPYVNSIIEDREGNIWLTTNGNGLIKYGNNKFLSLDFTKTIGGDIVRAIIQDSKGNYWFAIGGKGVIRYNKKKQDVFTAQNHRGLINVRDFLELPNGNILMASFNGLLEFNGINFKDVSQKYGLPTGSGVFDMELKHGELWIATQANGVIHYDKKNRRTVINTQNNALKVNRITKIFIDSKKRAWFANFQGVSMYDGTKVVNYDETNGLNNKWVMQVSEDTLGRIWVATFSGGINIWDGRKWTYLTSENGLSSDIAYSILTDKDGAIWVGAQNGVDHINYSSSGQITSIKNYNKFDGFIGIENNGACNYIDSKQNLWFGTIKGAMMFNPSKDQINPNPPIIQLTDIKLFFKKVNWRDEKYSQCLCGVNPWFPLPQDLQLTHDMHHLTFKFEALSYKAPEKVKYQWKLEGLDQNWSPVSSKKEATYSRIPPGEYTFKIKASNSDGVWTPNAYEYHFLILPPWYNTWWAISLGIVFVFLSVYLMVQIRIRNIQQKKIELEDLVELKTHKISSQKSEIESQNGELERQKGEIVRQSKRLQKSYMNLIHLNDIGKMITANLSVEKIIDAVYESVNELMDASIFGIGIYQKEKKSLLFPRIKEEGANLDSVEFKLEDESRLAVYCYNSKKEVFITDLENEYHKYITKLIPVEKTRTPKSVIYLPLRVKNKIIGVITVQSFVKHAYQEYHLSLLQNIGVYASIAIENAQSFQKIEFQSKRLQKANKNIRTQKEEIEQKNTELTDLNQEKNHLIGIIAHDLKNPLTSTISITEYLKDKLKHNNHSEDFENVSFMLNSLHRMNNMISNILDIGMIESNAIHLQLEKTNLKKLMEVVNLNFKDHLKKKQLSLKIDAHDTYALVDPNYMTQVYENLISNAIKYSPSNKKIQVKIWEEGEIIRSVVSDQGPGISKEEQKKLFGKFQVLSTKPTGGEKSTGLGLSIVKKYVDAMNGKVWCESEPGNGANFFIDIKKAV
ncbi:sensor histidine kinase [Ancylomarina longa]|uniref:histidine kinase n=1 Tax=Ancylomarina longa TaxID=2487017 RepID=A0A434AW06_9BACT|nr:two-component regulator propeller domain-containing protein [Ancylomarina longa]RUT78653.1 GAF domain-containing protein [Ancylomarina longa]